MSLQDLTQNLLSSHSCIKSNLSRDELIKHAIDNKEAIATKTGASALERLARYDEFPVNDPWVTPALIQASFAFSKDYFSTKQEVRANSLGSNQLYQYHYNAWRRDQGLFFEANKIQ